MQWGGEREEGRGRREGNGGKGRRLKQGRKGIVGRGGKRRESREDRRMKMKGETGKRREGRGDRREENRTRMVGGSRRGGSLCLTTSAHCLLKKPHPAIPWAPAHLKEMVLSALSATVLARSTSAVCR